MKKEKLKKILIVDNSSWNIYNFRLPLVKKLAQQGYETIVVSPIDEFIHYLNDVVFIRHIPATHLKPRSKNPFRDLLLILSLFRIYRREKPDLIFHFTIKPNIFGAIAAKLAGAQSISVVTGLGYTFLHPRGLHRLIPYFYKFAFHFTKKLVVYNPDDQVVFVNQQIVEPEKCVIVPGSGINTNHFRPLPKTSEAGKFIFLFIGRLLYDKGLQEYVEAARQVRETYPNVECWVAGDLSDSNPARISNEKLLEWVENQDIHYLGRVMDVRTIIRQASVVVLPSYREGVPKVMLEALSMGKPVITTDTAGCRETVVHGKNGYLVPVKDAGALGLAMSAMLENKVAELEKMGVESRKMALEFFDEKIITDSYAKLIDEIFGNVRNKPTAAARPAVF